MSAASTSLIESPQLTSKSSSMPLKDMSSNVGEVVYTVVINDPSETDEQVRKKYPSNYVKTTKYTILTFLPLNLFQQFMRFYNLYFLLAAILSISIPSASPISPSLTVTPLVVVLSVTMLKVYHIFWGSD